MLAVHHSLPSHRLSSPPQLEIVSVQIGLVSPLLVCVVYLPPCLSQDCFSEVLRYLETISSHPRLVLVGDFNFPDICWSSLCGQSPQSDAFCDFVFHHNLVQVVNFPTHLKGNILDLVLSSSDSLVENISHFSSQFLRSDHYFLTFTVPIVRKSSGKSLLSFSFNFKKTNFVELSSFLLDFDFNPLFSSSDVEFVWFFLRSVLLHSITLFTPRVKNKSRQCPVWFNSSIRHQLNRIHSLRKRCKRNPTPDNFLHLSSAELQLHNNILEARSNFESDLVTNFAFSNDPKIYQYMRSFSRQSDLPGVMHLGSRSATSGADKAELFNCFFQSVFNVTANTPPDTFTTSNGSLSSIDISLSDTFTALSALDPSKAMGGDGIPPSVLKFSATALLEPVHHLFSLCLSQSYLPAEWRRHHITPIYKSGDRSLVSNYRPISLLCCLAKVLERIVFNNVCDFLTTTSISLYQFGFVKNRSTLQQLLLYSEYLFMASDNHHQVDTIYLDIRKAFDTVPHSRLLEKLQNAGITGLLWNFFKAYLTDRTQCVVVNGHCSGWLPVISGVPQGSILGPLLFIVYINDLPSFLSSSQALLFADDTKCFRTILSSSDSSLLQADLDQLSSWSSLNSLSFNISKCHLLRFRKGSTCLIDTTYHLSGLPLTSVNQCKDLGIIFSSDLSWSHHYKMISSRAYCRLGLIRRIFSSRAPVRTKKLLYLSLVRSQLTYCSQVWRPRLIKDFTALERIQRRATKFILNDYSSNYRDRLITLNLLPLLYLYELSDLLFFIKCLKFPDSSFPIFDFVSFSNTNTRSSTFSKLVHQHRLTSNSQHSFFCRIVRLWNTLPPLDSSLSYPSIKLHLKKIFWSHFITHFDPSVPCTYHVICPCSKCSRLPVRVNFNSSST